MKKRKLKSTNLWACPNCPKSKPFEHKAIVAHIKQIHKITDLKGKKVMTLHLDSADTYTSQYEWTIGGLKFYQTVTNERADDDMMRFR